MKRPPKALRYIILLGVIAAAGYLIYLKTQTVPSVAEQDIQVDTEMSAEEPVPELVKVEETKPAAMEPAPNPPSFEERGQEPSKVPRTMKRRTAKMKSKRLNKTSKENQRNSLPEFFPASKSAGDLSLRDFKPTGQPNNIDIKLSK